jgi:hypothetical protein
VDLFPKILIPNEIGMRSRVVDKNLTGYFVFT